MTTPTPRTDAYAATCSSIEQCDLGFMQELESDLAAAQEAIAALKAEGDELARRVEGIAKWREKAHAYDRDVENEPRTFCEDVELIESAASGALDAYRAAIAAKGEK